MDQRQLPLCPECKQATVVLFTPPKEGLVGTPEGYRLLGTNEYIDWDRAHLYCCNATTNCKFDTRLRDLYTPPPPTT